MLVSKRPLGGVAFQTAFDGHGDMRALLLCGRRDAGYRLAVPGIDGCGVADDEYLGTAGRGQIRRHLEASRVVGGQAKPGGGR